MASGIPAMVRSNIMSKFRIRIVKEMNENNLYKMRELIVWIHDKRIKIICIYSPPNNKNHIETSEAIVITGDFNTTLPL